VTVTSPTARTGQSGDTNLTYGRKFLQMTHDEIIETLRTRTGADKDLATALISIVNLHVWKKTDRGMHLKRRCPECGFAYPCPTIEAIEQVLIKEE